MRYALYCLGVWRGREGPDLIPCQIGCLLVAPTPLSPTTNSLSMHRAEGGNKAEAASEQEAYADTGKGSGIEVAKRGA